MLVRLRLQDAPPSEHVICSKKSPMLLCDQQVHSGLMLDVKIFMVGPSAVISTFSTISFSEMCEALILLKVES